MDEYTLSNENSENLFLSYDNRTSIYFRTTNENEKAIADYSICIKMEPNKPDRYYFRGLAYRNIVQYEKAIFDFRKAIEIDAKYTEPYNSLAWVLATCLKEQHRNGEEAIALGLVANILAPDSPWCMDSLAAAYAENGNFEKAVPTQKKAINLLTINDKYKKLEEFKERLFYYERKKPWRE